MGKLRTILLLFSMVFLSAHFSFAQIKINQYDTEGNRNGIWKKYYKNKRLRYQGKFSHGKEIGVFKYFSAAKSDHPIAIKKYNPENSIAEVSFYNENGIIESKGKMDGKKRVGKWLFYHEDGKTVMSEENYVNGKLDGEYKTFYKSGKATEVAYYKNGLLDSVYKKYSIKGHLYQHFTYKLGKLNGKAVYYSRKTGALTTKGTFKNDLRVGTWENYVDGELISTEQPNKKKKHIRE